MKKEEFKLVEIEWVDITHLNAAPNIEFVKENKFLHFKNVGYLIYEDKEMVSITFSHVIEKKGKVEAIDKFRDILNLPRSTIKEIRYLGEKK